MLFKEDNRLEFLRPKITMKPCGQTNPASYKPRFDEAYATHLGTKGPARIIRKPCGARLLQTRLGGLDPPRSGTFFLSPEHNIKLRCLSFCSKQTDNGSTGIKSNRHSLSSCKRRNSHKLSPAGQMMDTIDPPESMRYTVAFETASVTGQQVHAPPTPVFRWTAEQVRDGCISKAMTCLQ